MLQIAQLLQILSKFPPSEVRTLSCSPSLENKQEPREKNKISTKKIKWDKTNK